MKRWTKIAVGLILLAIISQAPFIYRRHQLSQLRDAISALSATRSQPQNPGFIDYKGVMHVHSNLGGHSIGTLPEIVRAAESEGLKFVVMTEHPSAEVDTVAQTLNGFHKGVLFVSGTEVSAQNGDRFLIPKGISTAEPANRLSPSEIVSAAESQEKLALVAYPNDYKSWDLRGFNGVEVYNIFTDAKRANPILLLFDGLWSYRSFPDLLFARFYSRPDRSLQLYDQSIQAQGRPLVLTAGIDAHQNIGFGLSDSSGKKFFYAQLDPYERSFSILRNHVLLEEGSVFDEATLLAALKKGHSYIAFDFLCDTTGFFFGADASDQHKIMGDEILLARNPRLNVKTPVKASISLLRDGQVVQKVEDNTNLEFTPTKSGTYRVEVTLPQLGDIVAHKPWIISNPIYVR
jgi:hypothetical protein